jgi:hypothetical protein
MSHDLGKRAVEAGASRSSMWKNGFAERVSGAGAPRRGGDGCPGTKVYRAISMYLFRDEYIFDLEKVVVVEAPQTDHATYVFSKPLDVKSRVWQCAKATRQDVRLNRNNIAESLGFLGQIG